MSTREKAAYIGGGAAAGAVIGGLLGGRKGAVIGGLLGAGGGTGYVYYRGQRDNNRYYGNRDYYDSRSYRDYRSNGYYGDRRNYDYGGRDNRCDPYRDRHDYHRGFNR